MQPVTYMYTLVSANRQNNKPGSTLQRGPGLHYSVDLQHSFIFYLMHIFSKFQDRKVFPHLSVIENNTAKTYRNSATK